MMDDQELMDHVNLVMSMCTAYKMGTIDRATLTSNLRMATGVMVTSTTAPAACSCSKCTGFKDWYQEESEAEG